MIVIGNFYLIIVYLSGQSKPSQEIGWALVEVGIEIISQYP